MPNASDDAVLECGILAHGFARARCGACGNDFLIAFSCKSRGVCPARNTRRMAETAVHMADYVLPRVPVRQWVLWYEYGTENAIDAAACSAGDPYAQPTPANEHDQWVSF